MPSLMIECPKRHVPVAIGISFPNGAPLGAIQNCEIACPACGETHTFNAKDVFGEGDPKFRSLVAKLSLSAHYIKSNLHRDLHVDGIWGGVSPSNTHITMTTYTQKWAMPDKEVVKWNDKKDEYKTYKPGDIVRELDVTLIFDIQTAKSIAEWLNDHIKKAESSKSNPQNIKNNDNTNVSDDQKQGSGD